MLYLSIITVLHIYNNLQSKRKYCNNGWVNTETLLLLSYDRTSVHPHSYYSHKLGSTMHSYNIHTIPDRINEHTSIWKPITLFEFLQCGECMESYNRIWVWKSIRVTIRYYNSSLSYMQTWKSILITETKIMSSIWCDYLSLFQCLSWCWYGGQYVSLYVKQWRILDDMSASWCS